MKTAVGECWVCKFPIQESDLFAELPVPLHVKCVEAFYRPGPAPQVLGWPLFVRHHRLRLRISKTELAQRMQVDQSLICKIERYSHVPRRRMVIHLARALEVNVDLALLEAGYAPESETLRVVLLRMLPCHFEQPVEVEC